SYRPNALPIHPPALPDRSADSPLLANYIIQNLRNKTQTPIPKFSPEEVELLIQHNWPGNVRELENMVERAVVMGTQSGGLTLELAHLRRKSAPTARLAAHDAANSVESLEDIERVHIERVLAKC